MAIRVGSTRAGEARGRPRQERTYPGTYPGTYSGYGPTRGDSVGQDARVLAYQTSRQKAYAEQKGENQN